MPSPIHESLGFQFQPNLKCCKTCAHSTSENIGRTCELIRALLPDSPMVTDTAICNKYERYDTMATFIASKTRIDM